MESRVRTMSRGYVNVTEVIPAHPPHMRRGIGLRTPSDVSKKGRYKLKLPNCTAEYGTIRTQFVPLPLMKPRHPSLIHIFFRACNVDISYPDRPAL